MIVRISKRERFLVVANSTVRDPRLSFKATGLLVFLLSMPDGWETSYRHLSTVKTDGEHSVRAALQELEAAGYLTRERKRDDKGQWSWESTIHEAPCGGNPGMDNPGEDDPSGEDRRTNERPKDVEPKQGSPEEQTSTDVDTKADPLYGFDKFWDRYPKRNGKRLGKKKTAAKWKTLSFDAKARAWKAVQHYARACDGGLTIARDAERFLANDWYEDWADGPAEAAIRSQKDRSLRDPAQSALGAIAALAADERTA